MGKMKSKITKKQLQKLFDELEIDYKITKSDEIIGIIEADEDCSHDIFFLYSVDEENGRLMAVASAEFLIEEDDFARAYKICNKWNKRYPTQAYINDNEFYSKYSILCQEAVSEEFIKTNFIRLSRVLFLTFFCKLDKKLNKK